MESSTRGRCVCFHARKKWKNNMQVSVNLNYENYIFDLYGTLIDIHTDEEEKALWKALAKFYRAHGAFYFADIKREWQESLFVIQCTAQFYLS